MSAELTQLVVSGRAWVLGLAFALALAGCTRERGVDEVTRPAPDTPEWDTALRYETRYDAARTALVIALRIAPGFHAYTPGETIGKPLSFELAEDSPLKAAGPTAYPKGVAKDLEVGRSMIVEGEAEIVAPLDAPSSGASAKGTFRYQVCTDTACDRPRSAEVALTVP